MVSKSKIQAWGFSISVHFLVPRNTGENGTLSNKWYFK